MYADPNHLKEEKSIKQAYKNEKFKVFIIVAPITLKYTYVMKRYVRFSFKQC